MKSKDAKPLDAQSLTPQAVNSQAALQRSWWHSTLDDISHITHANSIKGSLLRKMLVGLPLIWLIALILASVSIFHETNRQNDIEIEQMARLLASIIGNKDIQGGEVIPDVMLSKKEDDSQLDAGFAVWDNNNNLIMVSELGRQFPIKADPEGFIDSNDWWQTDANRIFYLKMDDGKTIAIGRKWDERLQITQTSILSIFLVFFLTIPILIIFALWTIRKGLMPLQVLSLELDKRNAGDLTVLDKTVPDELNPFVQALNRLFLRVKKTMEQEQRFTADASHELRTPLSAIKAQSEVLTMTQDREKQQHHAHKISQSVDRATHLVEQLLILSRLDSITNDSESNINAPIQEDKVDWIEVSNQALKSVHRQAREKRVTLKRYILVDDKAVLPLSKGVTGDDTLLILLLRNLLDNAIRYGSNSVDDHIYEGNDKETNILVELTLASDYISVRDYGKGIAEKDIKRVQERFYRPAGQTETGSGLGLSIIERITQLYGLAFSLENHPEGGVLAKIQRRNP
ncbi:histidine kinase dimerization/phospho-acceptor domain-containing protein [Psychrobacter sp. H8-1]|uniref:histidine kinase dimerization/phospho-acceptor domain-containing protein n=1 Tax=Psychrobacter sp. H8-1 TaxID=2774129 RepID=UPI001919CDE1|nr:histidine kinase dimerization/phospho-acceptor domain-containing protein [Psychrobacter sp. H8-1]